MEMLNPTHSLTDNAGSQMVILQSNGSQTAVKLQSNRIRSGMDGSPVIIVTTAVDHITLYRFTFHTFFLPRGCHDVCISGTVRRFLEKFGDDIDVIVFVVSGSDRVMLLFSCLIQNTFICNLGYNRCTESCSLFMD